MSRNLPESNASGGVLPATLNFNGILSQQAAQPSPFIFQIPDSRFQLDFLRTQRDHEYALDTSSEATQQLIFGSAPRRPLVQIPAAIAIQPFINQTFFGSEPQRPPVQMPEEGVNAKALSEIDGFDTANIPSHFCCPLSFDIMDDPVIDPTTLNSDQSNIDEVPRFERAWLERTISEGNGKSPLTRQPIVSPLIPDAQRKTDIENFVQEKLSSHSSAAFSKN